MFPNRSSRALLRILALLLITVLAPPLRAQVDPVDETRLTGLRPMTEEERERMRVLAPSVLKVLPNATALKRTNDERIAYGLAALQVPVVPDGEELVFAPATAAAATGGIDATPPPTAAVALIPDKVDNAWSSPYFPPIADQGQIGSCVSFSSTYYMATQTKALALGLPANHPGLSDKLSPRFVYPLVNGGVNEGSNIYENIDALLKLGAPTQAVLPYSGANQRSNFAVWPTDATVWRNALVNKMESSFTLGEIDTDAGLIRLKTALANGSVLVFATHIYAWDFTTTKDDPATVADTFIIGRPVARVIRVPARESGHVMTITGYDDNVWVDLNKNGRVDTGEKGALRIANSWGNRWKDYGYVWLAYDALRVVSKVAGVGTDISANRAGSVPRPLGQLGRWLGEEKPMANAEAVGVVTRGFYRPRLLAEFRLKGITRRNEVQITFGRGDASATTDVPQSRITPGVFRGYQGGPYAFNGTTTAVDGTFVIDLTDIALDGTHRYFLTLRDLDPSARNVNFNTRGPAATLDNFRLTDAFGNSLTPSTGYTTTVVTNGLAQFSHSLALVIRPPTVDSPLTASGQVGQSFNYIITASPNPGSYHVSGLPAGLSNLDRDGRETAFITGAPLTSGTFNVTLAATNNVGTTTSTLVLTIAPPVPVPVITSPTDATATSGVPFSFQITATNSPTFYSLNGAVPSGLTVNTTTGLITGTPAVRGQYFFQTRAGNAGGTGVRALTLTIAAPTAPVPTITSSTTVAVAAGNLFSYRIQATNGPTSFGVEDLPDGLTLDATTGVITGRVSQARSYSITLSARNANGVGLATLTLDVTGTSSFGPSNDTFANRITLNGATASTTGSTVNATAEAGEPAHSGSAAATSVWWSWTAPSTGTLSVSTAGSEPAVRAALYTGTSASALTPLAPAPSGGSTYAVAAGTTYQIAIDSIGNNTGTIALALALTAPPAARPANDNFATAATLSGSSATADAITNAATAETGEPVHGDSAAARSVWYRWTAPAAGRVVVDTTGSDFDTLLAAYTGTALNALTAVAKDDNSGDNGTSEMSFAVVAAGSYAIAVDGFNGAAGNLALKLSFAAGTAGPANDNFANATPMTGAIAGASGTTANSSRETGEPAHAGYAATRSVWFRWVAPSTGLASLTTNNSAFDTLLAVYSGDAVSTLTVLASNDDVGGLGDFTPNANTGGPTFSRLVFGAIAGSTYRFAIDGYDGASGNYALTLNLASGTVANDAFAAAAPLSSGARDTVSNLTGTAEPGEPAHFTGSPAAKSLWWHWTASSTGFVSVSTTGSNFDTVLAVYTGTTLATLTRLAQNDDASFDDYTSTINFRAVEGRKYFIAVDGFTSGSASTAAGTIALTLTPSADVDTVYATDFENFTAGAGQLVNQDQWTHLSAPATGNAQGILAQAFPGQGQAGFLGYGAPDLSGNTSSSVYVMRPLNFDPVSEGAPLIQVRADVGIIGSTNGRNDVFRLSLYSRNGTLLGGFHFDTATRRVSTSDSTTLTASSFTFAPNTRYTLVGTFNFATRRWTARIDSTELVANEPFATGVTTADVGDFDFVWTLTNAQRLPGDNFIYFDNIAITANPVPTTVPAMRIPATVPVSTLGAPMRFAVTAISGPILSFSASGLPAGLAFNSATGVVTGTPTQTGTFNPTFTAVNAAGQSTALSVPLTILAGTPEITSAAAASARRGQAFSFQVTATNSPRTYSLRGTAALPAGLTLNTTTGVISGTPLASGTYRLSIAADNAAGTGSATLELQVADVQAAVAFGRLKNLSILTDITAADETFTLGYVVGGSGTSGVKPLVIRAAGPSLSALGVSGPLNNPRIELFAGGGIRVGENDDWGGSAAVSNAMRDVGAFPFTGPTSLDATIVASLPAGDSTVRVSSVGGGTGRVIAELYDATPDGTFVAGTPRLVNVSVLKHFGTGITAGFVLVGNEPTKVLIRAVGPTLATAPFNVAGVVANPQLTLRAGQTSIGTNDNWGGTAALTGAFSTVGAFPLPAASLDAALLITLEPGAYTVAVSGVGGTTGIGLIEVYEVR